MEKHEDHLAQLFIPDSCPSSDSSRVLVSEEKFFPIQPLNASNDKEGYGKETRARLDYRLAALQVYYSILNF